MSAPRHESHVGLADIVAFACELAMLVLVIASVNALIDGWRSWLIGLAVALAIVVVWARWMAPRSERRLMDPARYIAQAALFIAVGVLAAVSGLLWQGVVFTVVALGAFALSRTEDF